MITGKKRKVEENEQKKQWKCPKAWVEAEPVAATATSTRVVAEPISDGVAHIAAELLRVVGAKPGRWRGAPILEQPGSHLNGAGGLPSVPYVRDAVGEWPQMPQMQELCFAWFPPWRRRHRSSAVHGRRQEDLETEKITKSKLSSTSICLLNVFFLYNYFLFFF